MKVTKIIPMTICVLLLINCVSITSIPLSGPKYYPPTENVAVFEDENDIDKPYEKISIITAETGDGMFVGDSEMMYKLITKAKEIGADAIIFEEQLRSSGYMSDAKSIRVTAIKFKE
ncbi:MAG: hypothetical protein GWP19_03945 [Planctomycetia bacterium]|nr:hypothetical protein [Planctomycetia bacterium]